MRDERMAKLIFFEVGIIIGLKYLNIQVFRRLFQKPYIHTF